LPPEIVSFRVEGFAQNPNAFALQLLLVIAVIAGFNDSRGRTALLTLAVFGMCLTGSRAGWVALAAVAVVALLIRAVKPSQGLIAIAASGIGALFIAWLPEIGRAMTQVLHNMTGSTDTVMFDNLSPVGIAIERFGKGESVRMETLLGAWDLFHAHPVFGAGLGAFIQNYTRLHGQPLVIHSTVAWLAAEFGLVGLAVFAAPFLRVLAHEAQSRDRRDPARVMLLLSLVAFGVMSLAHDIFYQRTVWFLLGASLACTVEARSRFAPAQSLARDACRMPMDLVPTSE
ncbi:MAG: O-antigen ligase family protein, partial [Alphaproteobacteria bacterium]|nr:O-antigen ligase family protein [Alphaproteobacteria bacterium]